MRGLASTVSRLAALRRVAQSAGREADDSRFIKLTSFGSNPGKLRALLYSPDNLRPAAPLVVVMHGCTQNAAGYDRGAGWSTLADRHGFALLFPQQERANNSNLCFNWFIPADARRGRGETMSIRQMIVSTIETHDVDPGRVFVTGLSAGGAMTSVMLAAYPELFAGGAIIAGLPFGVANSLPEALERMRGQGGPGGDRLPALVTGASPHRGPWPTISVWHGDRDMIVDPSNADAIVEQWRRLHRVDAAEPRVERVEGHRRRSWRDATGRDVIEQYSIAGMGHGTPIDPNGKEGGGVAMPHMLDVGISSTQHIARFWGLTGNAATRPAARSIDISGTAEPIVERRAASLTENSRPGVTKVIEDALRAAGLMR